MSETHAPEKLQRKLGARHLNMIAIVVPLVQASSLLLDQPLQTLAPVERYSPIHSLAL